MNSVSAAVRENLDRAQGPARAAEPGAQAHSCEVSGPDQCLVTGRGGQRQAEARQHPTARVQVLEGGQATVAGSGLIISGVKSLGGQLPCALVSAADLF
jgi:hypothetical protein